MTDNAAIVDKLSKYRDEWFAQAILTAVGITAEKFPEDLKAALSKVFDVKVIEDRAMRAVEICGDARAKVEEVRVILLSIVGELDAAEKRIDALNMGLDAVGRRVARAVNWAEKLKIP